MLRRIYANKEKYERRKQRAQKAKPAVTTDKPLIEVHPAPAELQALGITGAITGRIPGDPAEAERVIDQIAAAAEARYARYVAMQEAPFHTKH